MPKPILDFFLFPGSSEEEDRLLRFWLRRIFILSIGMLICYAIFAIWQKLPADVFIYLGLFLLGMLTLLNLLNRGYLRLASICFCLASTFGLLLSAYQTGGVSSLSYHALLIVIILSGMFLRGRVTALATSIIILAGLVLSFLETGGFDWNSAAFLGSLTSWFSTALIFGLTAALIGIAARQVKTSMRQAAQEIEERRKIEATLREKSQYQDALHETTLSIINRLELLPLFESILAKAESLAETEHGYIDLLVPETQSLKQVVGHGVFAVLNGAVVGRGEGAGGQVLITGETQIIDDYQTWSNRIPEHATAGFRALAAVPLSINHQILGIIGLAHTDPQRKFSNAQLEILNQFAELAALAMENARLYQTAQAELAEHKRTQEALSRSEENLQRALDAARMGIWDWDLVTGKITWSENVYTIFGVNPQNFVGTLEGYLSFVHPGDRQRLRTQLETSLEQQEPFFSSEHRLITSGGLVRWIEVKGLSRMDETGKTRQITGTLTDITKRKEAEQAIQTANQKLKADTLMLERRSTLLQVAAEVSRAASAILDSNLLGQTVVDVVRKRFNVYYVGLFLVDESGKMAILRAATGRAGHAMLTRGHQLEVGNTSMVGWCIANQRARIALDVGKDAVRFNNPLLPKTRSEWVLPLISRGQTLGALTIQSKKEAAFSNEDIETFQTMTDQLANAILNARLYDQLERELEERKRVEEAIRLLNSQLEKRVQQRTAALQASEEKFRALSENNPLQVTRYDREGRYLYLNRSGRGERLPPDEVIGKKLDEVLAVNPKHIEFAENCLRQVFETGQPLHTEYALNGDYALWSLAPEFDTEGRVISVIASTQDITERKRMEEELNQRSLDLQAANKELEAFSYSVSHDLRAPLRAIDGFSRILRENFSLEDEAAQFLQKISEASLNMGQLIDDILRLSRITRAELRANQVDLGELAQSVLAELRSREPERQIKVEIQTNLYTWGDERLLRVALENLLTNAWKFTSKQENPTISLGAKRQDGKKVFFIRDNGVGFDMAYADKLFGAFQRLHTVDEFPGTGIGLAIVQRVIHKHGGRIWAEAEKGKGATFYFTL